MSHPTDEDELRARLSRAVAGEPPFGTSLTAALDAAERGGRRRRARAVAARGLAAGVTLVAVSAVAVSTGPFDGGPGGAVTAAPPATAKVLPSAAPSVAGPSPTLASPELFTTVSSHTRRRLKALATAVAMLPRGRPTVTGEDFPEGPAVTVHVDQGRAGGFDVRAGIDLDPAQGVARWARSCRLERDGHDGRVCRRLSQTAREGVWARTYPDQPGRETLLLAATTASGATVTVTIDNYTQTPTGAKEVGPAWQEAGVTPAGLRAAVRASGLTGR